MEKFKSFERILTNLNILRYIIQSRVKRADYSANKQVEWFYNDLLNLVYGWKLVKPDSPTYPGIDLESESDKLGIQVTSQKGYKKIERTLDLFDDHHFGRLQRVVILNIISKTNHSKDFSSNVPFDKSKDIMDIDDILGDIEKLDTNKIKEVESFIETEIPYYLGRITNEGDLIRERVDFRNVKARNCLKFLDIIDNNKELENFKKEIEKLHSKLLSISQRQRTAIFAYLAKCDKENLQLPAQTYGDILMNSFEFIREELPTLISIFEEKGLIYNDEEEFNPKIIACDTDLWYNVLKIVNENSLLHDFICNANFSHLDK